MPWEMLLATTDEKVLAYSLLLHCMAFRDGIARLLDCLPGLLDSWTASWTSRLPPWTPGLPPDPLSASAAASPNQLLMWVLLGGIQNGLASNTFRLLGPCLHQGAQ